MAQCELCGKDVITGFYIRAKAMKEDTKTHRLVRAAVKKNDTFVGYWPADDRLRGFSVEQLAPLRTGPDCQGHSVKQIAQAIDHKLAPSSSKPVRLLWNPGSRVAPYLPSHPRIESQTWEAMRQVLSSGVFSTHLRSQVVTSAVGVEDAILTLVDEKVEV